MKLYSLCRTTLLLILILLSSCKGDSELASKDLILEYPNLLNVVHTAQDKPLRGQGYFTDRGSWMGFTIPEKESGINGFCGPFDLDHRQWISHSLCQISATYKNEYIEKFKQDTAIYYPGKLVLKSSSKNLNLESELFFVDAHHALLRCSSNEKINYQVEGVLSLDSTKVWLVEANEVLTSLPSGEQIVVTFPVKTTIVVNGNKYVATIDNPSYCIDFTISYFNTENELLQSRNKASIILKDADQFMKDHNMIWNEYLSKNLREDMPENYNRILVKSIMTLMSNWRNPKGALLHAGLVPSHAMGYFVGFWAWDSWKHAVALSYLDTELAKDQIRTMFDYQTKEGMVIDCIYTDPMENNERDSKPPLATWAVNQVFEETQDTTFLEEMYPKLLKYYQWWYDYRDHDNNGICEFGSTDGTTEAAKWESGMDNAIRFDNSKMVKNKEGAWSLDQESIDLNAYLYKEYLLLQKIAAIIKQPFNEVDRKSLIQDYFFDSINGYFYDKTLSGSLVKVEGPEGWTPLWATLATKEQADLATKIMFDTSKFSIYIPFPTVTADHPLFLSNGYWRGPTWLDQVYFAISGIRKYGYTKEADKYTKQVFDRLQGLQENAPIHENYDAHTGERLKAPHFSWSATHLFLLYKEYGKSSE